MKYAFPLAAVIALVLIALIAVQIPEIGRAHV